MADIQGGSLGSAEPPFYRFTHKNAVENVLDSVTLPFKILDPPLVGVHAKLYHVYWLSNVYVRIIEGLNSIVEKKKI